MSFIFILKLDGCIPEDNNITAAAHFSVWPGQKHDCHDCCHGNTSTGTAVLSRVTCCYSYNPKGFNACKFSQWERNKHAANTQSVITSDVFVRRTHRSHAHPSSPNQPCVTLCCWVTTHTYLHNHVHTTILLIYACLQCSNNLNEPKKNLINMFVAVWFW